MLKTDIREYSHSTVPRRSIYENEQMTFERNLKNKVVNRVATLFKGFCYCKKNHWLTYFEGGMLHLKGLDELFIQPRQKYPYPVWCIETNQKSLIFFIAHPGTRTCNICVTHWWICDIWQHCQSDTGWSKETVDCKFLLTDQNFSKSVITQWFLESLYREVLVFWCFTGVRCVEFCLLKHFQYSAFVAPYKAWTLQNTLICIQTP